MDPPVPILPDPQRSFSPRESRIATATGRRDGGDHAAGLRIDLLNPILGNLKQIATVEGRPGMRGHIDRAQRLSARGIQRVQRVASGEPDALTVVGDAMHVVDARKRSVLTDDLGG
jgi:hypothetical protein